MFSDLLNGDLCRFCLSDADKSAVSLKNSEILVCVDRKLVDLKKILKFLLLNYKYCESLPNLICDECKSIIIKYYSLKKTFLENESTLQSKFQNDLSQYQKLQKIIQTIEVFYRKFDSDEIIDIHTFDNKIIIERSSYERLQEENIQSNDYNENEDKSKTFPINQNIPEESQEEVDYLQEEYIEDDTCIIKCELLGTEENEEQTEIIFEEVDIYNTKNDSLIYSENTNQENDYVVNDEAPQEIEDNPLITHEDDAPESKAKLKSKRKQKSMAFESLEPGLVAKKYKVSLVDSNVVVQEDNNYMCSNCSMIFANEKSANEHVLKYGKFQYCTQFKCDECSVFFSSHKSYQKHKSFHILKNFSSIFNYHDCLSCKVSFGNEVDYIKHTENHEKNENYTYTFEGGKQHIDGCEIFNQKEILDEHWSCGNCGMYFDKNELNFHLTLFHANLYCPFDKQAYGKSVSYLIDHLKTKHPEQFGNEKITFNCSHCFEEFATKQDVREHEKGCDSKKFECTHCNKKFGLERQLKEHLESVNGNMKYSCNFCGKKFNNKSSLTVHMRIHSKEKPYPCTYPGCNKNFRTNSHRSAHMDGHNETKNFKCLYCNSLFQTRAAKRAHEKSHNFSHICTICQKDFKQRSHLVRHANVVHKIKCGSANLETEISKHNGYVKKLK